ncbi:hypothetical protein LJR164_004445 [Phenylobacterium sp. LjRoot164]|uniref:hypothetical protein n=1 Tax=unclassified Phenylobacterium TaxID=2640670 RepID=UPI003ED0384D
MNNSDIRPDTLHRGVKMALDTGEAETVEAAYALFESYRVSIGVGGGAAYTQAGQAALLTMVNTARRALLGGIRVVGDLQVPLLVQLPGLGLTLVDAVCALGGTHAPEADQGAPVIWLGDDAPTGSLQVTFGDWRGGVFPAGEAGRLAEGKNDTPAAVLAGALAVAEVFQKLRGNPMATEREVGLSLWNPQSPWREAAGPETWVAPSKLWVLGLGHLGQAFLWVLGLMPFDDPSKVELTLQDFDLLAAANDSTSVLTRPGREGVLKTREMMSWAEARGFGVRLVERRFAGDVALDDGDPRVLFCGVDNAEARATLEDAGFDLVVDAGLGAGPQEFLAMRIQTYPGTMTARDRWGGVTGSSSEDAQRLTSSNAYQELSEQGVDSCGLLEIASRTVGAPFVGVVAATMSLMEVVRRLNGGPSMEVIDLTLRDIAGRQCVKGQALRRFNPGFTELSIG